MSAELPDPRSAGAGDETKPAARRSRWRAGQLDLFDKGSASGAGDGLQLPAHPTGNARAPHTLDAARPAARSDPRATPRSPVDAAGGLRAAPSSPAKSTPPVLPEDIWGEPATAEELHDIVLQLLRMGRGRESDELILRTARRSTRDIRIQLIALETALALERVEEGTEILERARLLATSRIHPRSRRALLELGVRLETLRRRLVVKPRPGPRTQRARNTPTSPAKSPGRAAGPTSPPPSITPPPVPAFVLRFRPLEIDLGGEDVVDPATRLADYRLRMQALDVLDLTSFETLLALGHVHGVDHYDYQLRTVQRVLREYFGRVLLADEVGLGKTVEACLCLKEYLLRGLVKNVLILVPPALRQQWRDELESKFAIQATIVEGEEARDRPAVWRDGGILIASLGLARLELHANEIARGSFDLVIVDEAHRLKNRDSRSWQLVDRLRSRFLMLLSATPVENDLVEIYNMITLLKPGVLSTEAEFKRTFVGPGGGRTVKAPVRLRSILRQVMIRNTRALAEAKLPPRFAATLRATPAAEERALYADVGQAVRAGLEQRSLSRAVAAEILRAAGSSPVAAASVLGARLSASLSERAATIAAPAKDALLLDLFARKQDEKILLFTGHISNLAHLSALARRAGRTPARFQGSMDGAAKAAAIAAFAADHDVLVSSESGGEGFNLQFARTIVNYDLPWNPMRIEQRIGRVHRIGQTRDVYIFNLVTADTLEEEVLRVLDEKINMFELVVGEIDAILGRLGDDELEFQELVLELYAGAGDARELRQRFDDLGERMLAARGDYEAVKAFEDAAFGRDLEV